SYFRTSADPRERPSFPTRRSSDLVQRTTYEAKNIINRFYGRAPEYSYFMGCSTGGREGMLAAQRLPLEFDGVVAGNPAFNLTRRSEEHTSELQSRENLVCRLLLEK